MASKQQTSQGRGWYHLRQRASNILRQITKIQGGSQKHNKKTQKSETRSNSLQERDRVVISETPKTHGSTLDTPPASQNDDSTSLGTWLDAFEQTKDLYPWLVRGRSFPDKNTAPFQVSNNTSLELDSENIYLNLPRNRMGLIVNPDLANSFYLFERRGEQYTVRAAISSRPSSSSWDSTSTGHGQLDISMSSPLPCSSAGRRLEALADELLLSLGVRPSPVGSKHESRDELESQSDLAQDPEPSARFEGFSDRFSFSKPASKKSIISSYSPTKTTHRKRDGSTVVDFTFFPELRRWVQKRESSSDRSASTQHPRAKCGICKASNLEIRELGQFDGSTTGDETEKAMVLPCGHMFGKDCLASWRSANQDSFSCPTCRSSLVLTAASTPSRGSF